MKRSDKVFRFIGKLLVYLLAVFPAYAALSPLVFTPGAPWFTRAALAWLTLLSYLCLNRLLWPDQTECVL